MLEIKIGIAGTAKNTGKTTTTAAIINELRIRGVGFFLTSIGYDGEDIDNITGLPKPKLRVQTGDIIATAEKCIAISTAVLKLIRPTDIHTPLGKVMVMEVLAPGLVVTAGPNKSTEVRELSRLLRQLGPGVTIFDGALNRIAPMAETEGFILATGASKTPNISLLAKETETIWRIANLPTVPRSRELSALQFKAVTFLDEHFKVEKMADRPSLLSENDVASILPEHITQDSFLYIPGVISERALKELIAILKEHPVHFNLAFADPIKLLVSSNTFTFFRLFEQLQEYKVFTGVVRSIPLLAVTVNPFYPEYRFDTKTYKPAYVDLRHLQLSVQRHIKTPVFNVVRQGPKSLVDIILSRAGLWRQSEATSFDPSERI